MLILLVPSWIEPFVFLVECRNRDVDYFELTYRAMAAARLNVDHRHRFDRISCPVEFDFAFAVQHEINFRHSLVIMRARINLYVNEMEGRSRSGQIRKR